LHYRPIIQETKDREEYKLVAMGDTCIDEVRPKLVQPSCQIPSIAGAQEVSSLHDLKMEKVVNFLFSKKTRTILRCFVRKNGS